MALCIPESSKQRGECPENTSKIKHTISDYVLRGIFNLKVKFVRVTPETAVVRTAKALNISRNVFVTCDSGTLGLFRPN